ncbi:hypothetical protein J2W32_004794 [Variovorax boronicumulans]|uniref:Uncharacterized protein n=1 Tax=Variovorax boronicumulans TaxID=436515 RepID=A0AAW8CVU5_9BURK|nr:hypothetical protein [Variovorax boronicumulans]MDP9895558.1 hypothetical protein [Variovorax boronicumulans]MDQ0055734.1 hypothetical protein [Variovorax boronicumulans]
MKRRLFSTVLALTALTTGLAAAAESPARPLAPPSSSSRIGSIMQIAIVDRTTGAELPIYRHRGEYWVAGRPGARYAIRARNAMGERIMAVMSVDGVNVVSGETAGIGQTGYVFGARENSDITGWRKSDSQIAAFEFASAGNSYASRTGRPDDVGVIGVALFRENVPVPPPPPIAPYPSRDEYSSRDRELRSESSALGDAKAKSAPAEAASSADAPAGAMARRQAPAPSLGTAHGRRETSYVGKTNFERAQSTPDEVVRIRYDSRDNLIAAGVIPVPPTPRWPRPAGPSPFPGSDPGYVPDPPSRY